MAVGIIGLGLIGGSLARALHQAGYRIYGQDIDRTVLLKARLLEIVDEELTDGRLGECETVILCIYPGATVEWLGKNGKKLGRGTVVMDTCGVKRAVCGPAWKIADECGFVFIGGHPMEGAAKIGFDYSTGTMFKKASMIMCPPAGVEIEKVK